MNKTKGMIYVFIAASILILGQFYYKNFTYLGKFNNKQYIHEYDKNSQEYINGKKYSLIQLKKNAINMGIVERDIALEQEQSTENIKYGNKVNFMVGEYKFDNPKYNFTKGIITADKMENEIIVKGDNLQYKDLQYTDATGKDIER